MSIYGTFNADGFPIGFYDEDFHGAFDSEDTRIPKDAVEIGAQNRDEFLTNSGQRAWRNGAIVIAEAPPIEIVTPPPRVPASVSDRQFFEALAIRGEITEDEALDAVGPGIIPARMLALIDQLPSEAQFSAKMLIRGATTFERENPLAGLIGTLFGWDAEALDKFWTFGATL